MNKQLTVCLILVLLELSCKNTSTGPIEGTNLLANPTFDRNGVPTLEGWSTDDTTVVRFSTDIPPGGKGHSLVLLHGPIPGKADPAIYQAIPAPVGTHTFRSSFFAKTTGAPGYVHVYLRHTLSGHISSFDRVVVFDSTWRFYFIDYTDVTSYAGDMLFVVIGGGYCGYCLQDAVTYFSNCDFELRQ